MNGLTVVNLECPATDISAPVPKEFNFRCDPDALPVARRYGGRIPGAMYKAVTIAA